MSRQGRARLWKILKTTPSGLVANSSETGARTGCAADFVESRYRENGCGWEIWREGSGEAGNLDPVSTIGSV